MYWSEFLDYARDHLSDYLIMTGRPTAGDMECPFCDEHRKGKKRGANYKGRDGKYSPAVICAHESHRKGRFDIFDIVGKDRGISVFADQVKETAEILNIVLKPDPDWIRGGIYYDWDDPDYKAGKIPHPPERSYPPRKGSAKTAESNPDPSPVTPAAEKKDEIDIPDLEPFSDDRPDFTDLIEAAHRDLMNDPEALKHFTARGFTLDEIQRFKLGYHAAGYNDLLRDFPKHQTRSRKADLYKYIIPYLRGDGSCHYFVSEISDRNQIDDFNGKYRKISSLREELFGEFMFDPGQTPETCFIVEGSFDALSVRACGYHAISSIGVAHKRFLSLCKAHRPETIFIVALDNDEMGSKATPRFTKGLDQLGLPYIVQRAPEEYKDMNETLQHNRDGLKEYLSGVAETARETTAAPEAAPPLQSDREPDLLQLPEPVIIAAELADIETAQDLGYNAIQIADDQDLDELIGYLSENTIEAPLILAFDTSPESQSLEAKTLELIKQIRRDHPDHNVRGSYLGDLDGEGSLFDAVGRDRDHAREMIEEAISTATKETPETESKPDPEELRRQQLEEYRSKFSSSGCLDEIKRDLRESVYNEPISTGMIELDRNLEGGFYPGLISIGAISSLGKTTLALQWIDSIAASGHDCLIFSLEMSRKELIAKSISRYSFKMSDQGDGKWRGARTTLDIMVGSRYKALSDSDRLFVDRAIDRYGSEAGEHVYIFEGNNQTGAEAIRRTIEDHIIRTGGAWIDLRDDKGIPTGEKILSGGSRPVVLIDYLQILGADPATADKRNYTDKQLVDNNILKLKRISRDYNIPVIVISAFNRNNYTEQVSMASFRDSSAIEYSADVLIGLQYHGLDREKGDEGQGGNDRRAARIQKIFDKINEKAPTGMIKQIEIDLKILKFRNADKGKTVLRFTPAYNYFEEIPRERTTVTQTPTAALEGFKELPGRTSKVISKYFD